MFVMKFSRINGGWVTARDFLFQRCTLSDFEQTDRKNELRVFDIIIIEFQLKDWK